MLAMRGSWRCARNLGVIFALSSVPTLAFAQTQPATAQTRGLAETLFREGRKLMKEKRFDEACSKLEESYRLDAAAGTLLNLGLCHEEQGKTATAWTELKESLYLAQKANRADRKKLAKERLDVLEPKLSRLTLTLAPGVAPGKITVRLDGVELGEGAFDTPLPVDPGERLLSVTAAGKKPWEQRLQIGAVADRQSVTIPVLEDELVPDAPGPIAPPVVKSEPGWQQPAGFVALGVGAVALGVGTYFGVRALSLGSESADHCPGDVCDAQGYAAYDDGRTAAMASNITVGVGLVAVVAGVVLLLTAEDEPAKSALSPSAEVSSSSVAFGLGGTF